LLIAVSVLVSLLCVYIAALPIGILHGKLPDPPQNLVADVVLRRTLPILACGMVGVAAAGWLTARRRARQLSLTTLAAVPILSVVMFALSGRWM
jgi:hypothetical protein